MSRPAILLALALAVGGGAPAPAGDAPAAFPFEIGGPYRLSGTDGSERTEADPLGRHQLLFFGYAVCEQICSAALPLMAGIADRLAEAGAPVTPVMITVDPARDTIPAMAARLPAIHPDFVGLTGDAAALAQAYDRFGVTVERLFTDPVMGDVYAHGSHLYLLSPQGAVLTVVPPVLDVDQAARIVTRYVTGS